MIVISNMGFSLSVCWTLCAFHSVSVPIHSSSTTKTVSELCVRESEGNLTHILRSVYIFHMKYKVLKSERSSRIILGLCGITLKNNMLDLVILLNKPQ